MYVDFNAANPIHFADPYARVKKVRSRVRITLPRVKDLYFVALSGLQGVSMEVLKLPEVV